MIQIDGDSYLDVREASERLGVKPETLYAYVSRGLIKSYRQGVRRRRLYLAHEIELLLALQPSRTEARTEGRIDGASSAHSALPAGDRPSANMPSTDVPPADAWATER